MNAGRELDALIAEKVMGWYLDSTKEYHRKHIHSLGHNALAPVPNFSTDIAAAWEVVEKFQGSFKVFKPFGGQWEVECTNGFSKADTAAHAICLAALKAVGC